MNVFGGCNADPDCWDTFEELLVYGCGPTVIIKDINTLQTKFFFPLHFGIVTCIRFFTRNFLIVATCNGVLTFIKIEVSSILTSHKFPSSITHISTFENNIFLSLALHDFVLFLLKKILLKRYLLNFHL